MGTNHTLKLIAVGDIMLGDHPVCLGHGVRSQMEIAGIDHPFKFVSPILRKSDVVFGNLECVLSDAEYDKGTIESREMRGRPEFAEALVKAGFTVVSVANNHVMQHGRIAFEETIDVLSSIGIFPVGKMMDGRSNVFRCRKGDIKLAIISYSLRPEKHCPKERAYALGDQDLICRHIHELANDNFNVIVSLHWGEEYMNYPSYEQTVQGHMFINEGTGLVLGHHPHVLQGVEKYNEGYIVYSLGNFVFDKWQPNPRQTIILEAEITKQGIKSLTCRPIHINNHYQPKPADKGLGEKIMKNLGDYTNLIYQIQHGHARGDSSTYTKAANRAYLKFRISSYMYFFSHIHQYSTETIKQSLVRFFKRRVERND